MDLQKLIGRFGADDAEPIYGGLSEATVVRLARGREFLYYKQGEILGDEADRLEWLGATGFTCPRVVDRGNGWMLTTELRGRDVTDDWSAADCPGLIPAARSFVEQYGGDPDDPRIPYYIGPDDSDSFWERVALR